MDNLIEDILNYEIFPKLTPKEMVTLSLVCKKLNNVILKSNFFNPFSSRTKRLKNWENNKHNHLCGIVLDRIQYMDYNDKESIAIFIKVHYDIINYDLIQIGIKYTNDQWKSNACIGFEHYKENIYYRIINLCNIKWFALYMDIYPKENKSLMGKVWRFVSSTVDNKQESWDNNDGWNYSTDRKYHWIYDEITGYDLSIIKEKTGMKGWIWLLAD